MAGTDTEPVLLAGQPGDLYLTGYQSIPTIGWLFLLQVIASFVLGAVVLAAHWSTTTATSPWTPAATQ